MACKIRLLPRAEITSEGWNEFGAIGSLGITAGASAPEVLVEEIIDAFAAKYSVEVEIIRAAEEDVFFPLPRPLRGSEAAE